jgi:hypothetical protein
MDPRITQLIKEIQEKSTELRALVSVVELVPDTEITRHEITWTVRRPDGNPVEFGEYANGDPYAVGPVEVLETNGDGSMLNPVPSKLQGYSDKVNGYDADLGVDFPITIDKGSLITVTEYPDYDKHTKLSDASVLTVVDKVPVYGSFRPPYCGDIRSFHVDDIDWDKLKNVEPVGPVPTQAEIERMVERLWLDHGQGWLGRQHHPHNNMRNYGARITREVGEISPWLNCNFDKETKQKALINFLQIGIDLYGITQANNQCWGADGGHCSGRLWPIVFAGIVLGCDDMVRVVGRFAEREQTYGDGQYRLTAGSDSQNYRTLNSYSWFGQAAAMKIMGANPWPPFLDYMENYYDEVNDGTSKPNFGFDMYDKYGTNP